MADLGTLRMDDLIIGSCQAIAVRYQAAGARKVAVSYYGCDVHAVDPNMPRDVFRQEFGLEPTTQWSAWWRICTRPGCARSAI